MKHPQEDKMDKEDIISLKEIYDKNEAIITTIRQNFSKKSEELLRKQDEIKELLNDPIYRNVELAILVKYYLEWVTDAIVYEEQTINQYEGYLKQLYGFVKNIKNQEKKVDELTEQNEILKEDIEELTKLIRKERGQDEED